MKTEWFPVYGAAYPRVTIKTTLLHLAGAPCKQVKPEHVMDDGFVAVVAPPKERCCPRCWRIASRVAAKAVA